MAPFDGGPAFPVNEYIDHPTHGFIHRAQLGDTSSSGMTLRDYFAGLALPGIAFDCGLEHSEAAERCYSFADAMIAERAKGSALDGWRDISSAPKDGTTVDLYGTRGSKPQRFTDAAWLEIHMMGTGDPTGDFRWFFPAWDIYGEFEFTHWRSIPAAPLTEEAAHA